MFDLIIVGGGPAGLTAGIYAGRQKLNTLLITKDFGGQIARKAVAIENYPGFKKISGKDLIKKLREHFQKYEIPVVFDSVRKIEKRKEKFLVLTERRKHFSTKTIIVASGADPRPLEVEGEKKFIGRGVSYCTTCDAPLFRNKAVAVIGGGNAGFEAALALSKWAKKIYILEYGKKVKADMTNQQKARKAGKIEVITSASLKRIKGKQFVNSIIYQDRESKNNITLSVEGVFVEIGSIPATSFVKGLVDFSERDEIKVEFETCQTKTPGIFAAGDCNQGSFKQIITACGEGAKAALAAYQYLKNLEEDA